MDFKDKKNEPSILRCPACDFDYLHPKEVCIIHAGKENSVVKVTKDGLFVDPRLGLIEEGSARGVRIAILFSCENGDKTTVREYQFHKGQTLFQIRTDEPVEKGCADCPRNEDTIWRD